jgi:hypothetical protein
LNRKVAGIALFLCFVAPLVATFSILQIQKKMIRKEVKHRMIAGMQLDELVLLKFTAAESENNLRWEHSKEFEYRDQMFDIVKQETKGDTTYYWCWLDDRETQLNKQLDALVAEILGGHPQSKEKQDKLTDFFKKLYCQHSQEFMACSKVLQHYYPITDAEVTTLHSSPPFPPPRCS